MFYTLRRLGYLRVNAESELVGVDHVQHGGSAYGRDVTDAPSREYPPPYAMPAAGEQPLPIEQPNGPVEPPPPVRAMPPQAEPDALGEAVAQAPAPPTDGVELA